MPLKRLLTHIAARTRARMLFRLGKLVCVKFWGRANAERGKQVYLCLAGTTKLECNATIHCILDLCVRGVFLSHRSVYVTSTAWTRRAHPNHYEKNQCRRTLLADRICSLLVC